MLCPACNDLSTTLYALLDDDPSPHWRKLYPFPAFPYLKSASSLANSQCEACELCRLLCATAQEQIDIAQLETLQGGDETISYQIDRYVPDRDEECMCITGLTFYFGWNDDPRAMRNFEASFFVELVSEASTLPQLFFPRAMFGIW